MITDGTAFRRALGLLVAGILLAVLDVAINGIDLLPDPLGWLLVALALGRMRGVVDDGVFRDRTGAALVLAWLAAVLSAVALFGALPEPLDVANWLSSTVQPVVTAFALLRAAHLVDAPSLRRSWLASTTALLTAFVVANVVILLAATTQIDDIDALGVFAVVVVFGAYAHYVLSIVRTRAALAG